MKTGKCKLIIGMLLFLGGTQQLNAQWKLPDCVDLFVTSIEQSAENAEEVLVRVYNECDSCKAHVYTGLKIYRGEDLLAVEDGLNTKPTPNNNNEYEYKLLSTSTFEITQELRIEMVGVCDSIVLSPVVLINGEPAESIVAFEVEIYPNPALEVINIKAAGKINFTIEKIRMINAQGQIVLERGNANKEVNISTLLSGFYLLEIETDKGILRKKLIKR